MAESTSVGGLKVSVEIEDHTEAQLLKILLNAKSALRAMAEATLARAQLLAPMSDIEGHAGTLRANGRIETEEGGMIQRVVFGGTPDVPYARYQEFGSESWHFTTPGTGPHYLQKAGESVAKEGIDNYL